MSVARAGVCALAAVVAGLTGCATRPSPSATERAQTEAIARAPVRLTEFTVAGRFSARRGEQSGTGQFRYSVDARSATLDVFAPTGAQLARIERAEGKAVVGVFGDGSTREAESFAELLRGFIDISLNDTQFFSWLQGIPADARTPTILGGDGRIESFRESGWSVVVSGRFDGDTGFVRRMRWSFDAAGAAQATEIRWVFDEFAAK